MAREREDIKRLRFWRSIVAEFIGSMLLVAIGCGTWTSGLKEAAGTELLKQQQQPSFVKVSLAFGLTYTSVLYCSRSVGDAHVTPGVTVALLMTRRVSFARGALYVIAQLIGAVIGAALAMLINASSLRPDDTSPAPGCTVPASRVTESQAFSVEFVTSFFFVFVVFACRDGKELSPIATGFEDTRGSSDWVGTSTVAEAGPATKNGRSQGNEGIFAIGLVYASLTMFAMPYTGGSFNPARSFGPALVNNVWTSHWIYWFGPLLGAVCGGAIYDVIFSTKSSFSRVRTCLLVFHQSRDHHMIGQVPIAIDHNGTGLHQQHQQHHQHHQHHQHQQQQRRVSRTHLDHRGRIQTSVLLPKDSILRDDDDYRFSLDYNREEDGSATSLVEAGGKMNPQP